MIYLAAPYTHTDSSVQESRYAATLTFASDLLKRGNIVFAPTVYGHQFHVSEGHAGDFKTWQNFNDYMLRSSTSVLVFCLDGWDNSAGVAYEIRKAKLLSIPVQFHTLGYKS